jgi:hypothetical protein
MAAPAPLREFLLKVPATPAGKGPSDRVTGSEKPGVPKQRTETVPGLAEVDITVRR